MIFSIWFNTTRYYFPESFTKRFVKKCIEERVNSRADIPQPCDEAEDVVADVLRAAGTRWHDHVDHEERGPEEHEGEEHNSQHLRSCIAQLYTSIYCMYLNSFRYDINNFIKLRRYINLYGIYAYALNMNYIFAFELDSFAYAIEWTNYLSN